jgi:holliday junction DNA helicase RuvA
MFAYIKGRITVKTPTYVVLENQGIGYQVFISLHTADKLSNSQECCLFTRTVARIENQNVTGYLLYGFFDEKEKDLFERLISVSGVGANTAIVMLSTYRVDEIIQAILSGNVGMIKSIKGIGPKSAERIILELRDKLDKTVQFAVENNVNHNTLKEEALMALTSLGFNKAAVIKVINTTMASNPAISTVEELIKQSLKSL